MRRVLEGWQGGIRVGGHLISNLRFADDTTIIGANETELATFLNRVELFSAQYGLHINRKKTKLMFIDRAGQMQRTGELRDLDLVEDFVYLGSQISSNGDCMKEVIRRSQIAKAAVKRLEKIWRNRNIYRHTLVRLMRTLIFSIFLYASETWVWKPATCESKNRRIRDVVLAQNVGHILDATPHQRVYSRRATYYHPAFNYMLPENVDLLWPCGPPRPVQL
ncbi:uncharacterized protein LOC134671675 [Cydia fagiglandana]|uniref:uncharacterized protein LOC134671675 n=1 Tax=Cydia fagiglandana TaxID=1458189 RepID=UPI002FEDED01